MWDTYGKLVGLNRTPSEIKKHLNTLRGVGIYVVYASMGVKPDEVFQAESKEAYTWGGEIFGDRV